MNVIALILAVFAVTVIRCVYLLRYPWGPCRKCRDHPGANRGSNRKRWGMCKACGGTGQRQRAGARAVHRFWWSIAGNALHERRKARVEARREKARYPELL